MGINLNRHRWTVLSLLIFILPARAWAWGFIGHEVAAQMAFERLTPKARAGVEGILGRGVRLDDIATWADEQLEVQDAGPWHYVNVPIGKSRYDARYCAPRGCVVSKIEDFRRVLMNASAGKQEKQRALKFLVHFVEDLHQPFHVGDDNDRGGNLLQVRFYGEGTNMHRLWDYQILERHTKNKQVWMWDLTFQANPRMVEEWSKGTPEDWATESLLLAAKVRRMPGSRDRIKPGAIIGDDYCRMALPLIQKQLAKAAIRIAWVLNDIFRKESSLARGGDLQSRKKGRV